MLTTSKSEERRFSVGLRPAASIRYDKEDVDCDYAFKAVLVGESFVGKTSLLLRFMSGDLYGERPPRPPPTLGLSSRTEKLNLRGLNVKVSIWDTAGQER
jgi:GTPase SAR1 family protein